MSRSISLWIFAFIITAAAAIYQRVTGPTYPYSGTAVVGGKTIKYKMERSHGGPTDCPVNIRTDDPIIHGTLGWKRLNTEDQWSTAEMSYHDGILTAPLPHQPPAGKLEYRVVLSHGIQQATLPREGSMVIRFKGDVPLWVLIPHVLMMFCGMLFSTRAGLEIFRFDRNLKPLMNWTLIFLCVGGFFLGPLMQWFAFGAFWTGWPIGADLTDNKTAVAVIAWAVAAIMLKRSRYPERWALGAAFITMAVFMIPHSVLGSELKYQNLPDGNGIK